MKGVHCDSDHNLAIAEVRKRLAVIKQAMRRFYMDRFNLKKPMR
jgi:hypothetical protein